MLKNKKALVMSVLCAVASVGFVMGASAETMHGNLEEVVVEGSADVLPGGMVAKSGNVGILGGCTFFSNKHYSQRYGNLWRYEPAFG